MGSVQGIPELNTLVARIARRSGKEEAYMD